MAQNSLGNLVIILEAQTAAFARGMQDAKNLAFTTSGEIISSLQRVGEQLGKLKFDSAGEFRKSVGIASGVLAGLGVAVAVSSIAIAKEVAEQTKQMGKLAQSYGLPIETISQLRVASKLTGVDMEQLTIGLGRLAKAASNNSPFFDTLGVSVRDAQGHLRPMSDLLPQVADRFAKMQDGTGKTALAMQLFGRSGAALIPLLNQGADGVKKMQELSDQLGLTWSEKDARAAEIFQQRVEIMELKTTALKESFTKGLLPALDEIVTAFVKTDTAGKSVAQTLGETVGTALKYVTVGVYSLITDWKELLIIMDLRKWGKEAQDAFDAAEKSYKDFGNAVLHGTPAPLINAISGTGQSNPTFPGKPSTASNAFADLLSQASQILNRDNPIQKEIDRIQDLQSKIASFQATHPEAIFLSLNEAAEKLAEAMRVLIADTSDWQRRFAPPGTQAGLQSQIAGVLSIPQGTPTLGGSVQSQSEMLRLGQDIEEQNRRRLEIYNAMRTPAEQYAQAVQELNIIYQQGALDTETYDRALDEAKARFEEIYDPTVRIKQEMIGLQQAIAAGAPNVGLLNRELKSLQIQLQSIQHPEYAQFVHNLSNTFVNDLGRMALAQESFGQGFANIWNRVVEQFTSAMLEIVLQWGIAALAHKSFVASQQFDDARLAASNTYAAVSSIPIVGPFLAPPAAAVAFAAVLAFAQGGIVPGYGSGDSVPAVLTPGEMVLPARLSQGLGALVNDYHSPSIRGGGSSSSSSHFAAPMTIYVNGAKDPGLVASKVGQVATSRMRRMMRGLR